MKILFIIPKNKNLFGDDALVSKKIGTTTGHPHLGIAYLTAFLKSNNVEVMIYDEMLGENENEYYTHIDKFRPDLIGITMANIQ